MDNFNGNFNLGGGEATSGNDANGMVFNLSGVDENAIGGFEVIPQGVYEAIIGECTFKESKKGAPMFEVVYELLDAKYEGRKIYDYMVIGGDSEKAIEFGQAKLKKVLVRVCPEVDITAFNPVTFANNGTAIGKQCRVSVGIQTQKTGEYKGEKRNTIKDVLAPETSSFM